MQIREGSAVKEDVFIKISGMFYTILCAKQAGYLHLQTASFGCVIIYFKYRTGNKRE